MADYKVIERDSIEQLENRVKELQTTGWVCQGGIFAFGTHPLMFFKWYQAMVKLDA